MNEKNSRLEEKFKTAVEYHKKNDFEKTEKILIEILELDPDHINANFFLGSLLLQKNEFSKAREFFLKVISFYLSYNFLFVHFLFGTLQIYIKILITNFYRSPFLLSDK